MGSLVIGESKRGGAIVLTSLNIKLWTDASVFIVKASVEPSTAAITLGASSTLKNKT
jgi:hypothetical protein